MVVAVLDWSEVVVVAWPKRDGAVELVVCPNKEAGGVDFPNANVVVGWLEALD